MALRRHNRRQRAIERIVFGRKYTLGLLDQTPAADWFGQPAVGVRHIGRLALAEYRLEWPAVGVPLPAGSTNARPPTKEEIEKLLSVAPRYGIEILLPSKRQSRYVERDALLAFLLHTRDNPHVDLPQPSQP